MRNETQGKDDEREPEPDPGRALPEMVIHERADHAADESDPEPDRLTFDEIINVVVTVCARMRSC